MPSVKDILIEIFLQESYLNIKISNNYKGQIDVFNIGDKNYTTKGKGHGFGLLLVKRIIDNNTLLKNERQISKKIFYLFFKFCRRFEVSVY